MRYQLEVVVLGALALMVGCSGGDGGANPLNIGTPRGSGGASGTGVGGTSAGGAAGATSAAGIAMGGAAGASAGGRIGNTNTGGTVGSLNQGGNTGTMNDGSGGKTSAGGDTAATGLGGNMAKASTGGSANTAMGGKSGKASTGGSVGTAMGGSAGKASTGGSAGGGASSGGASSGGDVKLPPANGSYDYQIGGAYPPPSGVVVVSRDRADAPAAGIYNICYVNGFQAQQADDDWWQSQHPDLVLRDSQGNPVVDPDWNEMLLDTSTAQKREALANVVGAWIQGCAADGFDAVEVDNLDSYSRSGGRLSQSNNVSFMKLLTDIGHAARLAMGQKNSTELLGSRSAMGTDFAVAEECNRYSECGDYKAVYGDLVFVIEYRDQDFNTGCQNFPELSIVRRDVNVTKPGSGSYVYKGC